MISQRLRGRYKGVPKLCSANPPCPIFRIDGLSVPGILSKRARWMWIQSPQKLATQTAQRCERCFVEDLVEGCANSDQPDR